MHKNFVYAKNTNTLIIQGIITKNHCISSHTENLKTFPRAKTNQVAVYITDCSVLKSEVKNQIHKGKINLSSLNLKRKKETGLNKK